MDFRIAYDRFYAETGKKTEALYQALRHAIVSGTLAEGARLPSSRRLAELYDVSRGSVNQAYDMLLADGFVRTERGRGTYVSVRFPETEEALERDGTCTGAAPITLSGWGKALPPVPEFDPDEHSRPGNIDFTIGGGDAGLFPMEEWKSAMYGEVRSMTDDWPPRPEPAQGHLPLREAIAQELRRERGIRADPSCVVVTNGSMQAIALLNMLLVTHGDAVVLENPCYAGTRRAVEAAGGVIVRASVDDNGIVPEDWAARLLFVTPTRHFPTGAVLPADRRMRLLEWAARRGAVIVEDDYDSELRWGGRPTEPLKALDREDRVVYLGTYSKTMYARLRIGYAVLPAALLEPFRRAKALMEPQPSGITEQRTLAHFIASGGYARHIRRMRRVCGRRLLRFQAETDQRLSRWFRFVPSDAGLHLYAHWLGAAEDYARLRDACHAEGVRWTDGDRFWIGEPECKSALFGFAHLPEGDITEGITRIEGAARRLFGRQPKR